MEKLTYSQYQKLVLRNAWERFKRTHQLFDLIIPLLVGLALGLLLLIAGSTEPVATAIFTLVVTTIIYCFLFVWYFAREHVFLYNDTQERINSYIEKYEAKPINVGIDLDEWEFIETIPEVSDGLWSYTQQKKISMVGIRVINKENNDLTNVYGCLNSLELRSYDGHARNLHGEATRNGPLFSWSGGSNDGEVSIKPGKDRILKIAEGKNRDLVFLLQNLDYPQMVNGTYIFEIEVGGKIFDKPIEPHKKKFYISFENIDKTFLGGESKPYGSTDFRSTSVTKGFTEYSKDSYRKLEIHKEP